jgi:hypothetical protein
MRAIIILLTVCLAAPAYAWTPCYAPRCAPRCGCGHGCGCGCAAGAVAGAGLLAVVAVALLTRPFRGSTKAEEAAIESAGRANQYENFLIAVSAYNKISGKGIYPPSRDEWMRWRASQGLDVIR